MPGLLIEADWRTAGRLGSSGGWLRLLAGDGPLSPSLPDHVQRWLCQRCEKYYLGSDPAPQQCPGCHRLLAYVGQWNLREERAPRWWRDREALDPGEWPL
jgi:hypothetical protein